MNATRRNQWFFWLALSSFLAWDWFRSPQVDLRNEPPLVAAGSGQASAGAHCSMPGK
jgi:hypothetical protein